MLLIIFISNYNNKIEPEGHWDDVENRKSFLTTFATKRGFDPQIAANWPAKLLPQLRAHGVRQRNKLLFSSNYFQNRERGSWTNMKAMCR